jgi:hypothetical protein
MFHQAHSLFYSLSHTHTQLMDRIHEGEGVPGPNDPIWDEIETAVHDSDPTSDCSYKRGLTTALKQLSGHRFRNGSTFSEQMFWKQVYAVMQKTVIAMWSPMYSRMKRAFPYMKLHQGFQNGNKACHGRPPCTNERCRCSDHVPSWCDSPCFNMLGFDLMMDENQKVWLLEVNARPSLNIDTRKDLAIKLGLMVNSFKTLGIVSEADRYAPEQHSSDDETDYKLEYRKGTSDRAFPVAYNQSRLKTLARQAELEAETDIPSACFTRRQVCGVTCVC